MYLIEEASDADVEKMCLWCPYTYTVRIHTLQVFLRHSRPIILNILPISVMVVMETTLAFFVKVKKQSQRLLL